MGSGTMRVKDGSGKASHHVSSGGAGAVTVPVSIGGEMREGCTGVTGSLYFGPTAHPAVKSTDAAKKARRTLRAASSVPSGAASDRGRMLSVSQAHTSSR